MQFRLISLRMSLARGDNEPGRGVDLIYEPMKLVGELDRGSRERKLLRDPKSDDVIARLVRGVQLHQTDAAAAPLPDRFHPSAGPAVIDGLQILVVLKPA